MAAKASSDKQKLLRRYFYFGVSCSIWEKNINKDGKAFSVYSASIQRSYMDANGQRQFTNSLNEVDWIKAAFLLQKAAMTINELRSSENEEVTE